MGFGERLKYLRVSNNMKQSDLVERLGVSSVSISHYEKEARSPDLDMLVKISKIFNVSVDNLLGNKVRDQESPDLEKLLKLG